MGQCGGGGVFFSVFLHFVSVFASACKLQFKLESTGKIRSKKSCITGPLGVVFLLVELAQI